MIRSKPKHHKLFYKLHSSIPAKSTTEGSERNLEVPQRAGRRVESGAAQQRADRNYDRTEPSGYQQCADERRGRGTEPIESIGGPNRRHP